MTKAQELKRDSLVKKLQAAREELGNLADDVSLSDYREGSNLSRAVDAVEGALRRLLPEVAA